ncbi:adenylyl-sulfate kinase [Chitinophaga japonensis]|uniref:adenylyl-sulfate kinase n=1 Tax=Chitinophaga japonensis TaxID=104662 RepID=A0A562T5Z1_CHIJA|nr:adenylyl-sulfate kinase [Chitinophaga japonensis]
MIIQLCGLSGAGKTTIARSVKSKAATHGIPVEIIDGDDYRQVLCRDLGFSREDRCENIRRLGFVAGQLSKHGVVCIISAINPYDDVRKELADKYKRVCTVYVDCPLDVLQQRDTKGLYKRAGLPDGHPDKIYNLTGVNDPFEPPAHPELHLHTHTATVDDAAEEVVALIRRSMPLPEKKIMVITGMHRSGTSMLAQWLHKCGLHVGHEIIGPGTGNEDGHFEDRAFFDMHRAILAALQLPQDGMIGHPLPALTAAQVAEIKALLNDRQVQQRQWGWKEPRTCLFLPVYRQLLPENALYLVIWRDFHTVVSSLIRRLYLIDLSTALDKKGLSAFIWRKTGRRRHRKQLYKTYSEHFLKVWINYNRIILEHLQQLAPERFLVISHARLADYHEQVFEHLAQWGFCLKPYAFGEVFKKERLSPVRDIEPYILDRALLAEAHRLQEQLSALDQLSTSSQALR